MESRLEQTLKRIAEADLAWARDGNQPEHFHLRHVGGMEIEIDHPRWDPSWHVPNESTIDDLGEVGLLRVEPSPDLDRTFSLSVKGREMGRRLAKAMAPRVPAASVPEVDVILQWLLEVAARSPEAFAAPARLLDLGVADGLVEPASRERLAGRIVALHEQGYLSGDLPDTDQWSDDQRLQFSNGLELTMKAYGTRATVDVSRLAVRVQSARIPLRNMRCDVFISHASDDKDEIARPLAEELIGRGVRVWFDEYELLLGDSLREKIDEGLASSVVGVVILSHSFFAKPWPQQELDGLLARLMGGEQNVMLPVWHQLTEEEVRRYSPTVAGRLAVRSDAGVGRLADDIVKVVERRKSDADR